MWRAVAWTCFLTGATSLLAPSAVEAQSAPPYEVLIQEAIGEFKAGNWAEAYTLCRRAHERVPNARTLRCLGITAYEMRRYPESVKHLEAALIHPKQALTPTLRTQVEQLLARAQRFVAVLEVELSPADAKLFVNGEQVDERPVTVSTGEVQLVARANGYSDGSRRLTVTGGDKRRVVLTLMPITGPGATSSTASEPGVEDDPAGLRTQAGQGDLDDSDGVLSQWWFWTGAGILVAGAVAAILITSSETSEPEPVEGNLGPAVSALEVGRF